MKLRVLEESVQALTENERRLDPLARPRLSAKLAESGGAVRRAEHSFQQEHVLRFTLETRFWANQAEYFEARRNAEKAVFDALFRDVAGKLIQLNAMIDHADRRSIQAAILELVDAIRP